MNMPPTAPAMPPIPTTDPTALRGNMSEVSVNRLADQPWWAAAAKLIMSTAVHLPTPAAAKTTGTTHSAQINIAVLRALFDVQPFLIKCEDIQPPPTLPMSAM